MSASKGTFIRSLQWGCLIILLASLGLTLLIIGWFIFREPPRPQGPLPTAILWTATPAPTPTATAIPPTPTPSTDIDLGSRVRVTGTGNVGLNLRAGPGTAYERLGISQEGDVFIVVAGPAEADDLTWWRLRDENNPTREGWAASNYLTLQNE